MNLRIEQIRPALPEEWDSVWLQCTYATYFHSREWAEIWSHHERGKMRPNPLLLIFSDGKEALLPLSCRLSGDSLWGFVSSPDGEYGGWIAVDPIGREHATLMKEFLTRELGPRLFWSINPFDSLVAATGIDAEKVDETYVINLERGFDAVYRGWSSACKRAERKALTSGILVKIADREEEWREYYRAYEDSYRRWGDQAKGSLRDWALFQAILDRKSEHVKLWLAMTREGCVAAGALMLYANAHLVNWHGAAFEEYFPMRPVNLLFSEIMRDACDKGYRWFDFYPNAGLEGLRRFQRSFGATSLDFSTVYVEPVEL